MPGLTQLPPPNPDFRHSNQEHLSKALGIESPPDTSSKQNSTPTKKTPPAPAQPPVDIRQHYKFD
jgi:hypothetical protein